MAHCVNVVCVFVCSCIHTVRFISFRFLFVCLFVDKHLFVWDSECVCMSCDRCEDAPQRHCCLFFVLFVYRHCEVDCIFFRLQIYIFFVWDSECVYA